VRRIVNQRHERSGFGPLHHRLGGGLGLRQRCPHDVIGPQTIIAFAQPPRNDRASAFQKRRHPGSSR